MTTAVAEPSARPRLGLSRVLWWQVDRRFFRLAAIPAFLVVFGVTIIPFVVGFGLSFSSVSSTHNGYFPATLKNYSFIFHDQDVRAVLSATAIFVVSAVVLETVVGLLLAILLAQKLRGIRVFRVIFILPLTVASIAAAISWGALLNTSQGWVNWILGSVGLPQPNWLASSTAAMPSVVLVDMWSGVPVVAVILLASLLSAPAEPIEAATVDGASALQRFRYVTMPAIRPALALAMILRTVAALQQFALFQILTGGGPGLKTTVLNYYVYTETFVYDNIGYGAALATFLLLVMVAILGLVFLVVGRR
jgi:multiple sugar transport system permease protein